MAVLRKSTNHRVKLSTNLFAGRRALPRYEAAHELDQVVALLRHRRRLQAAVRGHLARPNTRRLLWARSRLMHSRDSWMTARQMLASTPRSTVSSAYRRAQAGSQALLHAAEMAISRHVRYLPGNSYSRHSSERK